MNLPVSLSEAVALIAILFALILAIVRRKRSPLSSEAWFILASILLVLLFLKVSDFLEWAGITATLDPLDGYFRMLEPVLWGAFLYVVLQDFAESDLRESEARYRGLVETARDVIFTISRNGNFTSLNPAFETVTGWSRSDWVGKPFIDIVHPDEVNRARLLFEAVKDGEQPPAFEMKSLAKDGSFVVTEVTVMPQIRAHGVEGLLGIGRDITARREAEEALRLSEEKFSKAFRSSPSFLIIGSLADGRFIDVNDSFLEITGYTREEVIGHTSDDLKLWESKGDREVFLNRLRNGNAVRNLEARFRSKSGRIGVVLLSGDVIHLGGEACSVLVASDITDRKQAEGALRETEARYRSMVQNAFYGIYTATANGSFIDVNPALVSMLGFSSAEELIAIPIERLYRDSLQQQVLLDQYRRYGFISGVEVEWSRKDGSPITLRLSGRAVTSSSGSLEGFEVIAEDVSERRALEEQLRQSQKMEAVGRLAGGVAHDFNNLLTAIKGYSQLILRRLNDLDPVRKEVEEIDGAATTASELTSQLLAFSRKQMLQPRVIDLNQLVFESTRMQERIIGEDIELRTQLAPNLGRVKADPVQLEQVLLNLVVNARDAMPQGGKLLVETADTHLDEEYARRHVAVQPGPYVMLAVTDTGTGMDEYTRSRIFEPFFTTKERGRGTGLGLSTVYGIIRQSNGSIWVYSEEGKGTTFKIFLPRVDAPVDEVLIPAFTSEMPGGSETVLVVEDSRSVRKLACDTLRLCGYTVLEAAGSGDALLICQRHESRIHLMVTDVVMPHLSGPDLAKQLAESRRDMKVLYMSGYTDNAIAHHNVLDTGVSFLQKPFTPDAFARKVRTVLDN